MKSERTEGGARLQPPALTRFMAVLAVAGALAACESDTTQLIEEINAAREGCSEEQLKAADEACVQMFDRYAEMGEDAIETYIGGLRALDEALGRRGGIRFDTAGLGGAISDSLLGGAVTAERYPGATLDGFGGGSPSGADAGRRMDPAAGWETTADRDARVFDREGSSDPAWVPADDEMDRTPAGSSLPMPRPRPRGALLPPEERLRRPWIGDERPTDPYLGSGDRRPAPSVERPAPDEGPVFDGFREPIPPYPRE